MKSIAESLWKLAYRICSHETVGTWAAFCAKLFEALQTEGIIRIKMESVMP